MGTKSLADKLSETEDLTTMLRSQGEVYTDRFPVVPNEYTHWLDEQRAIRKTCALADLSHHMTTWHVEGPDTLDLLSDLFVNDFTDFEVGTAKQGVFCNPNGKLWGDGPILRLGEEAFWGAPSYSGHWLEYNVETGGYDVTYDVELPSSFLDDDPSLFIYQVQGPNALDVLEQLTDDDIGEVGFYEFEDVTLAGHEVRALGHGMSTESGYEIHGDYEHAEEIKAAIVAAGEDYGLRRLGTKAYLSQSVQVGWVPPGPPPVYTCEALQDFREWLPVEGSREPHFSISGSYVSEDVEDYYMSPVEIGYGKLVSFDHDFVGREALEGEVGDPDREKVTLLWDAEDILDVFGSIFREGVMDGRSAKWMDNFPRIGWGGGVFDEVTIGEDLVGISYSRSYEPDVATIASLAVVDTEHSDPGTEVTLTWGEPADSPNPHVEAHEFVEIGATVETVPYTTDRRKSTSE